MDGIIPIYEPGLEPLVKRGIKEGRLHFTTQWGPAVEKANICFLTVDTPPAQNGQSDLTNIYAATNELGKKIAPPCLVVTKSTVPVGTTLQIKKRLQDQLKERGVAAEGVTVASNPEFLKEGTSVQDFRYPDRIVVGVEKEGDAKPLRELYQPFMRKRDCCLVMDVASAELSKYAANAMLAARISFMNELAALSEVIGANIDRIRQSIGWDPRIGPNFLYPGLGYGGSCLPKDVAALIQLGNDKNTPLSMITAIHETNQKQKTRFLQKIAGHFGSPKNIEGKIIALWGLSFKPETDDIREAPALFVIEELLKQGARIQAFDPVAMENVRGLFGSKIKLCPACYPCLEGADALIIATEWNEFCSPDFKTMKRLLRRPVIFDGRNLYDPAKMREMGFDYFSIGR